MAKYLACIAFAAYALPSLVEARPNFLGCNNIGSAWKVGNQGSFILTLAHQLVLSSFFSVFLKNLMFNKQQLAAWWLILLNPQPLMPTLWTTQKMRTPLQIMPVGCKS